MRRKTFKELRQSVAVYAAAMRQFGVQKGDRVVGKYMFLFFLHFGCFVMFKFKVD